MSSQSQHPDSLREQDIQEAVAYFDDRYPGLASVLRSYFAHEEDETDMAITEEYIADSHPETRQDVADEAKRLMRAKPFPLQQLALAANRVMDDEDAARAWLNNVVTAIDASLGREPDQCIDGRLPSTGDVHP